MAIETMGQSAHPPGKGAVVGQILEMDTSTRVNERGLVLGILFLTLLVRALAAFVLTDTSMGVTLWEYGRQALCAYETGGDLCMYDRLGAPYASAYMPPLTSYLWLGLFSAFGNGTGARTAYIVLNVVVGALGPMLLYLFAREARLGRLTALAAALVLCFYPTFVFVSTSYHATNFTVALLLGFALALARALRFGRIMTVVIAGILCGLGTLTRTEMLLVGAGAGLLLVWRLRTDRRRAIAAAMAFGLATSIIVVPWATRNYFVFDRVIPVASATDYNMWKAFGPYAQGSAHAAASLPEGRAALEAIEASVALGDAPGARYEVRVQDAFAADTDRYRAQRNAPGLIKLTGEKAAVLWLFDWTDPLTHSPLYWAPWIIANTLVVLGAFLMLRERVPSLDRAGAQTLILLLATLTLSYAISGVHARYRMHIEPMLFIFAGVALHFLLSSIARIRA